MYNTYNSLIILKKGSYKSFNSIKNTQVILIYIKSNQMVKIKLKTQANIYLEELGWGKYNLKIFIQCGLVNPT